MLEVQQILPEIMLSFFAIIILLVDAFRPQGAGRISSVLAIIAVVAAALSTFALVGEDGTFFSGMIVVDGYGIFFRFTFLLIAGLTILASPSYLLRENIAASEYFALVLFATVGMNLMAASNELIMIFLGLETLSISSYILLGLKLTSSKSNESALKYFLLGSFSSAFLLYGIALTYGASRSTNLQIAGREILTGSASLGLVYGAIGFLLVGIGFKIAAAPFHVWTPDVYEGAPTPVTAFMSVGPKAAGFAVLIRVLLTAFPSTWTKWAGLIWISAVLTMLIGNIVALVQSNIKRMLAYSSIAHAGYILVAVATRNQEGVAAVLFYTLAYALMNIGAFTVVALIGRRGDQRSNIDDFSGLGFRQPFLAASLTVFMLSLAGIPTTAGFLGKFFIFRAAIESKLVGLAVIGVINSAISVYYYLRVIVVMYMRESSEELPRVTVSPGVGSVIGFAVGGIVLLGIKPDWIIYLARSSALTF